MIGKFLRIGTKPEIRILACRKNANTSPESTTTGTLRTDGAVTTSKFHAQIFVR
jgi:hypothetical protein